MANSLINRKTFVKYIKKYGFESTGRFNGTHEVFKSLFYKFNFTIPAGKKEIKKAIFWNFEALIKDEKQKIKINSKNHLVNEQKIIETDK